MSSPISDAIALARSETLSDLIRQEIQTSGGRISFARFMELALYTPELGYYNAGNRIFGHGGDFITAPYISALFTQSIARQFQPILAELKEADILEIGAGSGLFAKDVLLELETLDSLPRHYFIYEISAALRKQQQDLLQSSCPHLFSRAVWLDTLPTSFRGIIFANEVLDAMPVHCFHLEEKTVRERSVIWDGQRFAWQLTEPSEKLLRHIKMLRDEFSLPDQYESEINLHIQNWIFSLGDMLEQGVILLLDYGYGRKEYYHPDRKEGTLMCFYQHQSHSDPFLHIGLQDMTAHVDFTTVIENAVEKNLSLAGYTTQAAFLLACGLLENSNALPAMQQYQQSQAIQKLTLPSQMGEIVKVMALSKNFDLPLMGFALHDRRRDL